MSNTVSNSLVNDIVSILHILTDKSIRHIFHSRKALLQDGKGAGEGGKSGKSE